MQTLMLKSLALFKKGLFVFLLALLVFIPLYPKLPLVRIFGSFVSIRLEDIFIALFLLLLGIHILVSRSLKDLLKDRLNQVLVIFFFIGVVSLFSAVFVTHTVSWHIGLLHFLRRIELMLLLPAAYYLVTTKKQIYIAMIVMVVVTILVNLYGLGQQYAHLPIISTLNSELSKGEVNYADDLTRINSTFAGHYDLAIFLTMVVTIGSMMFFLYKSYITRAGIVVLSSVSGFVLLLTAARVSFVAVPVGIILGLWLIGKKIFIGILLVFVIAVIVYPSPLRDRLFSTATVILGNDQKFTNPLAIQQEKNKLNIPTLPRITKEDKEQALSPSHPYADTAPDLVPGEPIDNNERGVVRSFDIRLVVEWPRAIRALTKNPLLGTGYSSVDLATDNDYLRSLAEVGILGTIAFSLIFVEIFKRLWRLHRSKNDFLNYIAVAAIVAICVLFINAIFIDVFEASKIATIFWIMTGITIAGEKFS